MKMAKSINFPSEGRLSTAILRYPTGKYGIVGSIPIELTKISTHSKGKWWDTWGPYQPAYFWTCPTGTPQHPPNRVSMVWETEREAIDALLSIGVDRFQLSDCSWYKA